MEKEYTFIQMKKNMKDNGRMTKWMGLGNLPFLMGILWKENLEMIRKSENFVELFVFSKFKF